ncbi:MAG: hypothetical protein AB7F20_14595 [Geoalkalibacter sp.]|jgi:hypothetical protein|uniref:hypothetical protein n=1 Tax=Geoalkalibacter sp. TaxID=3041440 RepID=UPI003D0B6451
MKKWVFSVCLLAYLALWFVQEGKTRWNDLYLSPAPPAPLLHVASGYGRQMAGFALFVKVAIFQGGTLQGADKLSYADNMVQNFAVMTRLYPEFKDAFIYCQSFLAPIAPEYAERTNAILDRAVRQHPDDFLFPFYQAFNYFYYLDEPVKAAELFYKMSKLPEAPAWFGSLAGKLMGRGGNLLAGRDMLQAMFVTEQDEFVKDRYRRGIDNFNRAIDVQKSLDRYRDEKGRDADSLEELVPEYLQALPSFEDDYFLVWEPPLLRLKSVWDK